MRYPDISSTPCTASRETGKRRESVECVSAMSAMRCKPAFDSARRVRSTSRAKNNEWITPTGYIITRNGTVPWSVADHDRRRVDGIRMMVSLPMNQFRTQAFSRVVLQEREPACATESPIFLACTGMKNRGVVGRYFGKSILSGGNRLEANIGGGLNESCVIYCCS